MLTGKIRNQIDKVWEKFWTGGVTESVSVIEQISYLLFIRRLDELQRTAERKAQATGHGIEKPIFGANEQELRWSHFKDKDPDVMYEIVKDKVFPKIKNLQSQGSFAEHMKDALFIIPNAKLLDQIVQLLNEIDMNDKDTKGDLYEYLLSKLQQSGRNGQFRTPRHIIKMMVEMMQPSINDSICDPASGTCGFLMASVEYVTQHYQKELTKETNRQHFNNAMFTGFDFDRHMLRIGAMNMLLHGIENPQVHYRDSLQDHGDINIRDTYSLILANPPFKGSVDFDIISADLLRTLGKTPTSKKAAPAGTQGGKRKVPTEKSELLFLALILRMLKTGGRAAVIVPDGVLFGHTNSHQMIRKRIVVEQKLEAVISLPSGVFKPYAGVSTAILIFTKTNSGGTDKVWFYDMQSDGFSLDDKRTPLFREDEQPTHQQSNVADIITRFTTLKNSNSDEYIRDCSQQSFMVSFSEIEANDFDLNINRYKKMVYKNFNYEEPKVILNRIKTIQLEFAEGLAELEQML